MVTNLGNSKACLIIKSEISEFCSAMQILSNKDQHLTAIIVYEIMQLVSTNYLPFTVVNAGLICELCKSEKKTNTKHHYLYSSFLSVLAT